MHVEPLFREKKREGALRSFFIKMNKYEKENFQLRVRTSRPFRTTFNQFPRWAETGEI
jgi:hypothetical protein